MRAESRLCFSVTPESENRFTVSLSKIYDAFKSGKIKILDIIDIEQVWLLESKKCSVRIRKTENLVTNRGKLSYEHTAKYHIKKSLDYEVTTDISADDYQLLKKFYEEKAVQKKTRVFVVDKGDGYADYNITVDYPNDIDECWVEFETKDGKEYKDFEKPEWLE